jgi:glutathione S-transferase
MVSGAPTRQGTWRLIGRLESPYVRRVAVSMRLLGIGFSLEPISVFRGFEEFAAINPVVKAPTLVAPDGTVLMDSTLMLEHLELLLPPERRLTPQDPSSHLRHHRMLGVALAAVEKTVQLVYERKRRPKDRQHAEWSGRVTRQAGEAYRLLEELLLPEARWNFGDGPMQADITAAIAWRFSAHAFPGLLQADRHPALAALSRRAESLPAFAGLPVEGHGPVPT